jgi:hypothetical protein
MRLCAGRKCRSLFVAHVNPLNLILSPDRIGDSVQGIAANSVNFVDAGRGQGLHQQVGYGFRCHNVASFFVLLSELSSVSSFRRILQAREKRSSAEVPRSLRFTSGRGMFASHPIGCDEAITTEARLRIY